MDIGLEIVTASACLVSAIIFHELGHWRYLKNRYEGATIEFAGGYFRTYIKGKYHEMKVGELKPQERDETLWSGILAGMIPIVAFMLFSSWWVMSLGLVILYGVGCMNDFKMLRMKA